MWTEEQLRMMIDERKNNNEYYHTLHEGRKMIWWGQVASKLIYVSELFTQQFK